MDDNRGSVIALGMFDGMHMGHRAIITRMVELSHEKGLKSTVFTFAKHPKTVLGTAPKILMVQTERCKHMMLLGVHYTTMYDFDMAMAAMSPGDFLTFLKEHYGMQGVVVGYNYAFGRNGAGDSDFMKRFGEEHGFFVEVVPPVCYRSLPVSSTRIRTLLAEGELEQANDCLMSPYMLLGTIEKNKGIGTEIGFPTANLSLQEPDMVVPKEGVYISRAYVSGRYYESVTSIGNNPTVGGTKTTIETHMIGLTGNYYGEYLEVQFLKRIRDNVRFDCVQDLSAKIAGDVAKAKSYFLNEGAGKC